MAFFQTQIREESPVMVVGYRLILNVFSSNYSKIGLPSPSFLAICLLAKANHIQKIFFFPETYQEGEISLTIIMLAMERGKWVMLGRNSDICGMLVMVFLQITDIGWQRTMSI